MKIINRLLQDYSILRVILLRTLLKTVSTNLKQGNLIPKGFEYGHVFSGTILERYKEFKKVNGVFGKFKIKSA